MVNVPENADENDIAAATRRKNFVAEKAAEFNQRLFRTLLDLKPLEQIPQDVAAELGAEAVADMFQLIEEAAPGESEARGGWEPNELRVRYLRTVTAYRMVEVPPSDFSRAHTYPPAMPSMAELDMLASIRESNKLSRADRDDPRSERMWKLLDRLFADAPKMEGTKDQAPALDSCQVILCNGKEMIGALSKTPEGTLRFLTEGRQGDKILIIEYFFDVSDLQAVAVMRAQAKAPESQIFQG